MAEPWRLHDSSITMFVKELLARLRAICQTRSVETRPSPNC